MSASFTANPSTATTRTSCHWWSHLPLPAKASFAIYFVLYAIVLSLPERRVRDKYTPRDANICVVVYATGKVPTLENLVKQLKNQNYPKNNYTIYTILDKCEDVSDVTLQSDLNVNVVNINNLEPIGKSQ